MRRIGLIGGMSFEATALYYQQINEAVRDRMGGLHSAELLLYSVDFQKIVEMQRAAKWQEAGECLAEIGLRLQDAGADAVLICAVTMHLVAPQIEAALSVPCLHIVDVTAERLKAAGRRRPLLLATRYTMENGFYAERMARHGIEVMVPDPVGHTVTHDIIFNELCAGLVRAPSRAALIGLIEQARQQGADSVILGCTEICMILNPDQLSLPGYDSTAIHVAAAVDFALG